MTARGVARRLKSPVGGVHRIGLQRHGRTRTRCGLLVEPGWGPTRDALSCRHCMTKEEAHA